MRNIKLNGNLIFNSNNGKQLPDDCLFYKSSEQPPKLDVFTSPVLQRRNVGLYKLGKLVGGKLGSVVTL